MSDIGSEERQCCTRPSAFCHLAESKVKEDFTISVYTIQIWVLYCKVINFQAEEKRDGWVLKEARRKNQRKKWRYAVVL